MRSKIEVSIISTSLLICAGVVAFLLGHITQIPSTRKGHRWFKSERHSELVEEKNHWPHIGYKSSPFRPPKFDVSGQRTETSQPYIFTTPRGPFRESGKPVIFALDGDVVFVDESHGHAADFKVQKYNGEPHLTVWDGWSTSAPYPGHGYGKSTFLDDTYEGFSFDLNATINALVDQPPGHMDFHEHIMTDNDTLLVSAYNNTPWDLSSVGEAKDGWLASSMIFEIDVATKEVIYSWEAAKHIALNGSRLPVDSYMGNGTQYAPWDFFHINSIEDIGRDRLLVNSRHTWSSYVLSKSTGDVTQKLDGYELGFSWAHHARAHSHRSDGGFQMTLFDNHNMKEDKYGNVTQGLLIDVDPSRHTAEVIRDFKTEFYADSQGSFQLLDNGNYFLGGGRIPAFVEFDPQGKIVYEARFAAGETGYAYRAFRGDWVGTPRDWDPSISVESRGVYVSWNGATEVESWNLYVNETLKGRALRLGFETLIHEPELGVGDCVVVGAVQHGMEVRRSRLHCVEERIDQ